MRLIRGDYEISDDPDRLDLDSIHAYLHGKAYWSRGIPRDVFKRAVGGSLNFGLYKSDRQVGYARVVTDRATFAWLCDLFVDRGHQRLGLGHWLVDAVLAHPDLRGLRRVVLATADAHRIYRDAGFSELSAPERWMEIAHSPGELYGSS